MPKFINIHICQRQNEYQKKYGRMCGACAENKRLKAEADAFEDQMKVSIDWDNPSEVL